MKKALVLFLATILLGCISEDPVDIVKSGYFKSYQNISVGDGFDNFLGDAKWESGVSTDGDTIVNLTGVITYDGEPVNALVQFIVGKEKNEFQVYAFEMRGEGQNQAVINKLIDKVFNDEPNNYGKTPSDLKSRYEVLSNLNNETKNHVLNYLGKPDSTLMIGLEVLVYDNASYDPVSEKEDMMIQVFFQGDYVSNINFM